MKIPLLFALFFFNALASFLLSGMEAGVLVLNRMRVRQLARKGHQRAKLLHTFLEKPEHFLWTILVGNTLANFIIITLVVGVLIHQFNERPALLLVVFILLVFLLYAVCDLLPKMLFRAFPNRLCMITAPLYQFMATTLAPLVGPLQVLTNHLSHWFGKQGFTVSLFGHRDELRLMMQESAPALSSEERQMIKRVLELQNITVSQIAIPLDRTVTVTTTTPMREVMEIWREKKINRIPVRDAGGGTRQIAGIISLRAVLYREDVQPDRPASQYVKPAMYLDEDTRLEVALGRLQRSGERMAIVLARDKREIGVVTLQDILRVVFGEVSI
ncbi:MAG: CNNM domain-containing protein [Verrucomicrobiota bacterium]